MHDQINFKDMDKKIKNSLFFGAAIGGLFALARNAGEKQKLTTEQLQSVSELTETLKKLDSVSENISLAQVFTDLKVFDSGKKYKEIIYMTEKNIQKDAENLGIVKSFKSKLQYVLSGRFTEQRNNTIAHKNQSAFLLIKGLPDILISLIEKRTKILRLLQKVYRYVEAGEATDFKPNDSVTIKTYISEFNALQKQAEGLLGEFSLPK